MRVLVACEESQAVTRELRALGVEAYSCDILETSGNHPEWHLKQDVIPLLREEWDMVIAFPPCTYLTVTGNRWFNVERYGATAIKRLNDRRAAIEFVKTIWNANSKHIAIENPVGVLSTEFMKPSQIIEPYFFGDPYEKRTCLWLKNLPPLEKTDVVASPERVKFESGKTMPKWYSDSFGLPKDERAKFRSKTFPGVARAMATQWVEFLKKI